MEAIKQYLDQRIKEKTRDRCGEDGDDCDLGMIWAFQERRNFIERLETIPLAG